VQGLRPLSAAPNSSTLIAAAQVMRELDDVYFPFNRQGKYTEHQRWPRELAYQQVAPVAQRMIAIDGADSLTGVARAKKAMVCLLYASPAPLARVEQHLTQHQLGDGAAGAVRATAARTRDMIPAVVRVFEFLNPGIAVGNVAEPSMVRLELGIPAELAELGSILGGTLTRAQYLTLLEHEAVTPDQFGLAAPETLADWLSVTANEADRLQKVVADARRRGDELVPLLPPPVE
jgi:helicase